MKKTICIVEDNKYVREAWALVIQSQDHLELIGSFQNAEEALEDERLTRCEIALLDVSLPGMLGTELVAHLLKKNPSCLCIMISVHEDDHHIYDAIVNGAIGYLPKRTTPVELLNAIEVALHGGSPMTPIIARKAIEAFSNSKKKTKEPHEDSELTDRERTILELLSKGETYQKIAELEFLSVDGVRYHIRSIYKKLEVHSRGEAVAKWYHIFKK